MLTFRILCAVLMAWAINWSLSRPEAADLLAELPIMGTLGPIAGAGVGFVNLASRQGWGVVVAVANGVWAGLLSIAVSGVLYMVYVGGEALVRGGIQDFSGFMRLVSGELAPLFDLVIDVPLVVLTITATAVLGVFTELLHWAMVRIRRNRVDGDDDDYA